MASGIDAWAAVVSYGGYWHAIGGGKDVGMSHLADNGDRLLAMAAADDFLRSMATRTAANKTKRWLSEPPSDKQLAILKLADAGARHDQVSRDLPDPVEIQRARDPFASSSGSAQRLAA
jgi:hypothetical protein